MVVLTAMRLVEQRVVPRVAWLAGLMAAKMAESTGKLKAVQMVSLLADQTVEQKAVRTVVRSVDMLVALKVEKSADLTVAT